MLKFFLVFLILSSNTSLAKYITVTNGNDVLHVFDDQETELAILHWKKSFSSIMELDLSSFPKFYKHSEAIFTVIGNIFYMNTPIYAVDANPTFYEYVANYSEIEKRIPSAIITIRSSNHSLNANS